MPPAPSSTSSPPLPRSTSSPAPPMMPSPAAPPHTVAPAPAVVSTTVMDSTESTGATVLACVEYTRPPALSTLPV